MIISHKYKFIFIKTMKTAGTSIEVQLSGICPPSDVFTTTSPIEKGHQPRNFRGYFNPLPEIVNGNRRGVRKTMSEFYHRKKFQEHLPACVIKDRISPKIWNSYFKFCVERNPWDKTISRHWMTSGGGKRSFDDFMERKRRLFPINYPFYTDGKTQSNIIVDRILYYENLHNELDDVMNQLGVPWEGLNVQAKGGFRKNKRHYSEFYTDEYKNIVAEVFEKEIKFHNYKFEED